jgi:S1-C subfamily serine protease
MRVLLLPGNPSSERVVECLTGWSRSGLLEPFAWCSTANGRAPSEEALVHRVESGEDRELLLGAALQGSDSSQDELIAFYPATPEEGFESGFASAAIGYVELLSRTIAHDATRPARCTMVIAPSQIGQAVPAGLLSQSFASNVYIAPEDRAEPRDPNRLLGNEEVFPMHAAHAIATVGDLWDEPECERPSVVEVLAKRQPHNQLATQVIRCFSRAIDFGYLPDHVSAGIFYSDSGWPNPDPEVLDRIDDPESVVPHVVNDYMQAFRQELGLSEFKPHRLRDPAPLGLFEAFRLLVNLIAMRIRRKPFEMVRQRLDSIHNAAADWVEKQAGPDSGIRVKRRGQVGGGEAVELEEALEKPLVVPDGPVAEAWSSLRQLVLSLIDGSDLPEGVDRVRLVNGKGQRALITEPAVLAPDPDADPPPISGWEGQICDPLRLDPSLARAASPTGSVPEALAEWAQLHSSSLVWKVGARIGADLQTAERESEILGQPQAPTGEDEEDEEEKPTGPEQRRLLRKQLRKTLLLTSFAALLAAAVAIGQLSLIGIAVALVAVGALWFLGLASAARRWFLADEKISRQEDEEKLTRLNASLRRSLRMGDAIRLRRRYREYLDWAEMLGWLVHKPWVGDPLDRVALSPPIDHGTLPAAFSVGVAEISALGLERLSAAAGGGVFGPGWLAGLYEMTERLEMTEIGIRRGLPSEEAEVSRPDPADDISKDREGPRRRLLDAIRRGKHRSLSGSKLGNEVLRYLGDLAPDRVCERVAVLPTADRATVGEEIDALPPPLAGFQPPASLPDLVADLAPAVVRIECDAKHRDFGGTGVIVAPGVAATALELVEGARSVAVVTADGERHEAELKGASPAAKLALVSFQGTGDALDLSLSESTSAFQGDAVISIGRPFADREEPTCPWGFVTASERELGSPGAPTVPAFQVAYHRAEGAGGAPVFNLGGELLGIHCSAAGAEAGDLRSQRVSNVIPVAEVRRLVEEGGRPPEDRQPQMRTRRIERQATITPSAFIEELTHVDPPPALLPHHWKDAEKKNETKEAIPSLGEAAAGTDSFSVLAGRITFLSPLRILVHRVDLVAPVNVRDLKSFPDTEGPDKEPEEQVVTKF